MYDHTTIITNDEIFFCFVLIDFVVLERIKNNLGYYKYIFYPYQAFEEKILDIRLLFVGKRNKNDQTTILDLYYLFVFFD